MFGHARALGLVPLVGMMLLAGCARERDEGEIRTIADLEGRSCGIVTGSVVAELVDAVQKGVDFNVFNDYPSMVEALRLGKIDAVPLDTVVLRRWSAKCPGEFRLVQFLSENPYGYFFQKGSPLRSRVNAVLAGMKASGDLDRIVAKWCDTADLDSVELEPYPHRTGFTGKNGTLRMATASDYEPGSFIRHGEAVGFDIDIVKWVACELDMDFELVNVNVNALVPAVQSGKADIGGGLVTITASRAVAVDFSECYLNDGYSLMVRASSGGRRAIRTAGDLKGRHVAHMSSDFHRQELRRLQPDLVFDPYSEYAFAFESLRNGKIDAISIGGAYAEVWTAKFPGEFKVAFDYADDVCCFLFPRQSPLRSAVDAELRRMNEAGETEAIVRKWIDGAKVGRLPALPPCTVPSGAPEIHVASSATSEPWCLVADGEVTGIDIEVLTLVANRLGMRLRPKAYSWGGMVDCVNAGRCDIANGGIYTAGNTFPTVDGSVPYAKEKMCLLVRDESRAEGKSGIVTFVRSLKASFIRTFVIENRWRMLLNGFGITMLITFLAALLGTALAFPVWLARTSRIGFVSACAKGYVAILQGTPVLVLLMVLFYIVFGKVNIDSICIAVIGFALNLSAYAGETLRSGVGSVPRGQTEAALALGYTPRQAFFRFVLPQAVRLVLPVYRGELIGLLKSTSIVGYIAIGDLTKMSDIVRSRTYESFFPIITTAFVYFAVSWLLAVLLERVELMLTPGWRKRSTTGSRGIRQRSGNDRGGSACH